MNSTVARSVIAHNFPISVEITGETLMNKIIYLLHYDPAPSVF